MDRQAILDRLRVEAPALREKYRLESLAVVGRMARGDDREESNVDVLVTFADRADFDRFMGLKLDLEDRLLRSVDLATPSMIRPGMGPAVERDLIPVFGVAGSRRFLDSSR